MNAKAWMPLGVAIVLGGIAAKVGRDMMSRKEVTKTVTVNMSRVVVAKENISPGTALKAESLVATPVAEGSLPPGSFRDVISLNNRVVTMAVIKGQPILENMLAPEGTSKGLTAIVPDGMRAVTLEVNEVSGVAGMLVPGCRIDIVSTLSGEGGQMVARTIARNLQIVAIGRHFAEASKDGAKDEAPEAAPARSVTVLATPREAELIDLAAHTGTPRLVLRGSRDSRTDLGSDSEAVTVAELRGTPIERGSTWGQSVARLIETFSKAQQPAPRGLFTESAPQPTTKPADVRNVMVIRNTKEQAVQIEKHNEPKTSTFVETDRGDAINK
jgi:pilus assembly protein CpaB